MVMDAEMLGIVRAWQSGRAVVALDSQRAIDHPRNLCFEPPRSWIEELAVDEMGRGGKAVIYPPENTPPHAPTRERKNGHMESPPHCPREFLAPPRIIPNLFPLPPLPASDAGPAQQPVFFFGRLARLFYMDSSISALSLLTKQAYITTYHSAARALRPTLPPAPTPGPFRYLISIAKYFVKNPLPSSHHILSPFRNFDDRQTSSWNNGFNQPTVTRYGRQGGVHFNIGLCRCHADSLRHLMGSVGMKKEQRRRLVIKFEKTNGRHLEVEEYLASFKFKTMMEGGRGERGGEKKAIYTREELIEDTNRKDLLKKARIMVFATGREPQIW
ncbi:hypothetical protein EV426DRAFT_705432 [Tirmania nivea]|nr:hypothetical protein EV426DRAFT_705432 [Tirmania nivea]